MSTLYIGIDNGCTGSIGIITSSNSYVYQTPSNLIQDFTKKKQNISRLDRNKFTNIILGATEGYINELGKPDKIFVAMERPFWNPSLSPKASKGGVMCLEAQLGIIETLQWAHDVVDSTAWQKLLLPAGTKGSALLKKASKDIGIRLFPHLEEEITKQKDADGILIAEWARRSNL